MNYKGIVLEKNRKFIKIRQTHSFGFSSEKKQKQKPAFSVKLLDFLVFPFIQSQ